MVVKDQISDYDVVVTKDDVRVLGCKVYRENIVLPPDLVGAGDVLEIHLTSKTGETLDYTTEVTLDERGYASTEFEVVQKGRCKVSPIGADISSVSCLPWKGIVWKVLHAQRKVMSVDVMMQAVIRSW